ncbi:MAG: DEAD/DEAH box helicase family protein [Candidatus Thermoplasmatota archaeon]|nr:DEAD/DEAH box helicase family protein [Candidatus Thermoplasmatota archaeon]
MSDEKDPHGFMPREYQKDIASSAGGDNVLIVLPTGMGKTAISAILIEKRILNGKNAIFLAPTKPLCDQQSIALASYIGNKARITVATGEIPPEKRGNLWGGDYNIIVSTPQTAINDLPYMPEVIGKLGIAVFDEAHRATGDYPYVKLAELFSHEGRIQLIGLTASPGDQAHEMEILKNLNLSAVIRRSFSDSSIKKYTHSVDVETIKLKRTDHQEKVRKLLDSLYLRILSGLPSSMLPEMPKRKDLIDAMKNASAMISDGDREGYRIMNLLVTALRIDYAREYAETQGIDQVEQYLLDLQADHSASVEKSLKTISNMDEFNQLLLILKDRNLDRSNPKFSVICRLCSSQIGRGRVIVFAHYRKTGELLADYLTTNCQGISARAFYGHGKKGEEKGMSQKTQTDTINAFRNGEFNVLVATSIGEEGLDIPDTDLVIFYEPVASEIRTIQRMGRTGRFRPGMVKILMFEDGREIPYYYISSKTFKRRGTGSSGKTKPKSLYDF